MPQPEAAPGEALVRVQAAGVNFADIMSAAGGYPGTPKPPLIAGREFCGELLEAGSHVMGYTQWGAFAEIVAARTNYFWPVPSHWTPQEGAAFPVNYFTAYLAYWKAGLIDRASGDRASGDRASAGMASGGKARVLIHAVAGGVGTAAVQIGKLLGVETYGTSSSAEKLARVKELGLDHGINYRERDYEEAIRELTGGEGVPVVYDGVGKDTFMGSLDSLKVRGMMVTFGNASGPVPPFDPLLLSQKGAIFITRPTLAHYTSKRDELLELGAELFEVVTSGKVRIEVNQTYALADAANAHRDLEARKTTGSTIMLP